MKHSRIIKYTMIAVALVLVALLITAVVLFFFPSNARYRSSTSIDGYGRFIQEMGPLYNMSFPD